MASREALRHLIDAIRHSVSEVAALQPLAFMDARLSAASRWLHVLQALRTDVMILLKHIDAAISVVNTLHELEEH